VEHIGAESDMPERLAPVLVQTTVIAFDNQFSASTDQHRMKPLQQPGFDAGSKFTIDIRREA
jgi:hypothetical protein